jgi:hypothetical protein
MPKSQRFDNPAKKKTCEQIGITHKSVDFRDFPSHYKYRVPTLGYGYKILPVERDVNVPGTGRYQLPSLFDRFK